MDYQCVTELNDIQDYLQGATLVANGTQITSASQLASGGGGGGRRR